MKRLGVLALTIAMGSWLAWLSLQGVAQAHDPFPNCRLGAAVVYAITDYAYTPLNLGWYVSYSTSGSPLEPDGIEFVQTVQLHQNKYSWCRDCYDVPYSYHTSPPTSTLPCLVVANPGSTWLIGNEPDRRDWSATGRQDEIVPELYAQAYYEISQVIRQADPTAKVGIGGVVQATPLRLKYLDRVWNAYQSRYGRRLGDDVDVWNVHGFVLREMSCSVYGWPTCWGAEIPAGLNDAYGLVIQPWDNDRLDLFQQQLIRFRTWMRGRGERNKPLYITEYGINMPSYYVSANEVKAFMTGTFDFSLNYKDSNLGYPADENRLVQRSIWYSLDDSADTNRVENYADSLFSAVTHLRQPYGDHWAAYVQDPAHAEAHQPRVNLLVLLSATPPSIYDPTGTGSFTFTLRAQVANGGNTPTTTGDNIRVSFWDGPPGGPGSQQIGATQVFSDLAGCGAYRVAEVTWPGRSRGANVWYAQVDSVPGETLLTDNVASANAFVVYSILYLPLVLKAY